MNEAMKPKMLQVHGTSKNISRWIIISNAEIHRSITAYYPRQHLADESAFLLNIGSYDSIRHYFDLYWQHADFEHVESFRFLKSIGKENSCMFYFGGIDSMEDTNRG